MEIMPLFDEDADAAVLADLEMPGPPGHPLEGMMYKDLVDANEAGMAAVHGETSRRRGSWSGWTIRDDRATLLHQLSLTHLYPTQADQSTRLRVMDQAGRTRVS